MMLKRTLTVLLPIIVLLVAILSLSACSAASSTFEVTSGIGEIKIVADRATKATTEKMSVGSADAIEVVPDIKSGEISVTLSDGNGTAYGAYTFNSTDKKHKLFYVDSGDVKIQIDAKDATGTLLISETVVLDGPGTPGS